MKGVKKLNKQIQNLFNETVGINLPITLGSDFFYYPNKQKINFSIAISEQSDRCFKAFLKNFFNFGIFSSEDLFCVSLLHEIGHYFTYDNIDENTYNESKGMTQEILELLQNDPTNDEIYSCYFELPIEIVATTWAINWIAENPIQFENLVTKVSKYLCKFYEKNIG